MTSLDPEDTGDLLATRASLAPSVDGCGPYLVVCSGSPRAKPVGERLVVGRSRSAGLHVEDAALSREHFAIECDTSGVRLVELGSQHGTNVDGARVASARTLRGGELIRAGHTLFYFHDDDHPPPPRERIEGTAVWSTDPAMATAYTQLERLAASELPVLLLGETGTGKEVAARAVHAWSRRAGGPFVAINCAAIPEALVESELFGHERGAFSSATAARSGLFEAASGGTLFLDEVGDLAAASQAKILRALETQRVQRLGESGVERAVDVRVVSATNAPLTDPAGFRRDLFFRLSGAAVTLPPLRQRPADVVTLSHAFFAAAAERLGRAAPRIPADAMEILLAHAWPGNVRELRHLADYVVASGAGPVVSARWLRRQLTPAVSDVRSAPPAPPSCPAAARFRPIEEEVRELERRRMSDALRASGGNRTRAAELISMPRRTFLTKLKHYQLAE